MEKVILLGDFFVLHKFGTFVILVFNFLWPVPKNTSILSPSDYRYVEDGNFNNSEIFHVGSSG